MIRNILIKIGHETIILYGRINGKKPIEKMDDKKVENRPEKKVIENNIPSSRKDNKKYPIKLIIPVIIIILLILPQYAPYIIMLITLILLTKIALPRIKKDKQQKEILKTLPYALRQISTELKAGMGLFDSMKSITESDYGALSYEFNVTLTEIKYGTNYEEAFKNLATRINLDIMNKITSQIIRTLNNGGNLSEILSSLADENSYNLRLKYKEYSEKLNALMLLYMFIAVLLPVILFIMIIAATTVMGSIIKPELLLILYFFFFPMIISFMILLIKRMEPTI